MPSTANGEAINGASITNVGPLLKEFTGRIEKIGDQIVALGRIHFNEQYKLSQEGKHWIRTELHELAATFTRIRPSAEDLDRYASQLIEYGRIEELERWELLLRLAELELAINVTQSRIAGAAQNV